ncbi:MAG TPA: hypothetical protein VFT55_12465 [Planctomycetota bacterium]|nr:hypothetical protein [Planctomycetota bacterium]
MSPGFLMRCLPWLLLAACLCGQNPVPVMPAAAGPRYVDFSKDLARPDVLVVVGRFGKWKEGKRERLADGRLGGPMQSTSVSGTQYFKVPVQAPVQPRATFHGKADKIELGFDIQLARLPDGKERRQSMTGNGASLAEDQLALFVMAPRDKGKGMAMLHVIPFDPSVDQGADAEAGFTDTMHDFYVVNQRVHELETALAAVDKAADAPAKAAAGKQLEELLAQKPQLHRPKNDGLLAMHVAPLEQRARTRLAELAKEAREAGK